MTEPIAQPTPKNEAPQADNIMMDYPLVSIAYCVRCKWMLRAAWYQQEILQTFGSKPDQTITAKNGGIPKLTINSVLLKPSLVAGTFTIAVKVSRHDNWIVIWDRKMNGGFPDSKTVKQKIRDLVRPGLKMGHLDRPDTDHSGTLLTGSVPPPVAGSRAAAEQSAETPGSPLGRPKTFTEECLECTRTWEG